MSNGCDIFDSALDLEERHVQEGLKEGRAAGRKEGRVEGGGLGVRQGFQIGQEIGYYSGCTQMWRYLDSKSPGFLHPRAEKVVSALEQLLISFPLQDPKDERLQELMDSIRGRYKAATSMLNATGFPCYSFGNDSDKQEGLGLRKNYDF